MKRHFVIFLLLFTVVLSGYAQTGKITGHLVVKKRKTAKDIAGNGVVMLKVNGLLRNSTVNSKLSFSFDHLKGDTLELRVVTYHYQDTVITVVLKNSDSLNLNIPYPPYCKYEAATKNSTCPVCKKKDMVIPVKYGYILRNGTDKKQPEYRAGGNLTTQCYPHWYCKRDELEF